MNEALKIAAYAISGGILTVFLSSCKKEYAFLSAAITCVLIMSEAVCILEDIVSQMYELSRRANIRLDYITLILRAVGIAYITEFACELLKDAGAGAIAKKAELAGKIIILNMALPIIGELMEVCINAIKGI